MIWQLSHQLLPGQLSFPSLWDR